MNCLDVTRVFTHHGYDGAKALVGADSGTDGNGKLYRPQSCPALNAADADLGKPGKGGRKRTLQRINGIRDKLGARYHTYYRQYTQTAVSLLMPGGGEKAVPSGRVEKLRKTFEPLSENDDRTANNCHVVAAQPSSTTDGSSPADGSKKSASVVRSESLRTRGRENKQSFRKRSDPNIPRSNSDVDGDDRPVSVLNQSGSSSNSSLSTKSLDSPSNSLETVHKPTSNEISPLTSATPLTAFAQSPSGFASSRRDENNEDSDFDVEPNLPNWSDSVEWEIVRHLKPKEKKRQDVINELIYTEQTHVRNLKVLDRVFFRPMLSDQVLPLEHIKLLFPNLEEMIEIHSRLNKKLKKEKENPIVGNIGEILLEMFDGASGENFRKAAAMFCKNQSIALESLKARQKKEQKVAQFLAEASSNPLCRRFELKDLIPTGMQRLTKYPLLLENLAKYTCATTPEYTNLTKALECSKEILNHVNQAVKEAENYHRLGELQKKIDRGIFEKVDHPISTEYKHLDLTQHKMLHEGSLQWRINRQKLVDLHVLLLEDILVLLQKQDEKYVLKFHNTSIMSGREETKLTHSPIIKVHNLLTRNVAIDKRAFFLVSTSSQVGPQIYELVALSSVDQKTWLRHITEAAEAYKVKDKVKPHLVPERDLEVSPEDNFKPSSLDNHDTPEQNESNEASAHLSGVEAGESSTDVDADVVAASPAVAAVVDGANGHEASKSQPPEIDSSFAGAAAGGSAEPGAAADAEGSSTDGGLATCAAISGGISPSTPQGHPPLLAGTSPSPQRRFQRVEILQIAEGPPLIEPSEVVISEGAVLQTAEPVLAPIEKLRRKEHVIKTALAEKHDLVAEILHIPREQLEHLTDITNEADGEKDAKELVVAAMVQVTRLANLINESLTVTEEDAISAGSSDEVGFPSAGATGISPPGSVSPRMMHSPKVGRKASRMPSAPVHVLLNINAALSVHMTQLLALISEREEERVRMRKELRSSREQIHLLHDARRRTPVSQSPSHSRPNSFISMSSSASELCDATDQMYSDGDQTLLLAANVPSEIPSTLEAYNKLVYQPPFVAGGAAAPPICLVNDHPEDVGALQPTEPTFELFVDAPTESSTDDPEPPPPTAGHQQEQHPSVATEASRDNRVSGGGVSPVRWDEAGGPEEAFAVVMPSPTVLIDTSRPPVVPAKDYDESAAPTTEGTTAATSTTATDYGAIF